MIVSLQTRCEHCQYFKFLHRGKYNKPFGFCKDPNDPHRTTMYDWCDNFVDKRKDTYVAQG